MAQQTPAPLARPVAGDGTEPARPVLSKKEIEKRNKAWKNEVSDTYRTWVEQDVKYIITDDELQAFKMLSNDDERDQFIENFWLRRDPTPDTEENEYKEEHYRRIAYANDHFASGVQGWRTDRGRMYITWGPADEIESHPSGGSYNREASEGGGTTSTYPFERWRWRHIDGIGDNIILEFVDTCQCNEYHLSIDPNEKDALLHTPNAGPTQREEMGQADRTKRVLGIGDPNNPFDPNNPMKVFDRLELMAHMNTPPPVKFKDLAEDVSHHFVYNFMPFDVHYDMMRITSSTVLVPITIQMRNKDISFVSKEGLQTGTVNIFGRLSTITGKVATTFEDTVSQQVPEDLFEQLLNQPAVYWKALPLRPGRYRLDIVLKDVNGDRKGSWSKGIVVPAYPEDKLSISTLILADLIEKVPRTSIGAGNFVIGDSKIRPRVEPSDGKPASFKKTQTLNLWMQVYNLAVDGKGGKPSAGVEYEVVNVQTNKAVFNAAMDSSTLGIVGDQMTLIKSLALSGYEPGTYKVTVKVTDNISRQVVTTSGKFAVE
jgi:GWxTD domain-containing protein